MTSSGDRADVVPAKGPGLTAPGDDAEDADPSLAQERTSMAWTRTAISFAALGGALLRTAPPAGALILAMSAMVWGLGRVSRRSESPHWHGHLLVTITVALVSVAAFAFVLLTEGRGI